jgi:hypothetical protein
MDGITLFLAAIAFGFNSGSGETAPGHTQVTPGTMYTDELGYGFEPGGMPVYFSVKVPEEGNYRVTVTIGDSGAGTVTTPKAELRRPKSREMEKCA